MKVVKSLALSALIATGGLASIDDALAKDLRWKMPIAFSSTLPGLGSPAAWVAEATKR